MLSDIQKNFVELSFEVPAHVVVSFLNNIQTKSLSQIHLLEIAERCIEKYTKMKYPCIVVTEKF